MSPYAVYYNGRIYTMDESCPLAEAVAICGNRIVWVGKTADVQKMIASNTMRVDLRGKTVIPGMTDSHVHFVSYALSTRQVKLDKAGTLDEALTVVRERVAHLDEGSWVIGRGWDRNLWMEECPRKEDLDKVSPQNPVALYSKDGHTMWINSITLNLAGVSKDTPQPAGGEIEKDRQTREPTGLLKEKAQSLVSHLIPEPTLEEAEAATQEAVKSFQRVGVTAVTDFEGELPFKVLQNLLRTGKLGLRVALMFPTENLDAAIKLGIQSDFGNEKLRIVGVKILADGAFGSRTAAMLESYEDDPENKGIMRLTEEELHHLVEKATSNRINVAVHSIGDRANRIMLNIFEANVKNMEANRKIRCRIEHAQHLTEKDVRRFGELGVIASVQPIHIALDFEAMKHSLGKRGRWSYPFRSLLSNGAKIAFGSDAPVASFNPLLGIYTAITRRNTNGEVSWHPEECLTVEEAVKAYTVGGAYAAGEEDVRGTISPGKLADMVALSENIFEIPSDRIKEVEVEMTIFDGEIVYQKAGSQTL